MNTKMSRATGSALQIGWIVLGFFCLALSLSPVIDGDGQARYLDLLNLMKGEKPIDKFSSIQLLLAMPLYVLGSTRGAYCDHVTR